MEPVSVSIDVRQGPAQVFAFLDVMANHERFNDHFMRDWSFSGPTTGVGAQARVTTVMAGRREPVEFEVIDTARDERIVERNVGAGGRRVATGTYLLSPAGTGTTVNFVFAWERAPLGDRLAAPLVRAMMGRVLRTSLDRLREALAGEQGPEPIASTT